jgi:CDP-paratose 2-epimerase
MSCIYGPRQFGNEDQGWIAHFLRRARAGQSLTIYGNGKQVRDVLFIDDLVAAFTTAERHLPALAGRAFNIGGGPANTLSLIELLALIDGHGLSPRVAYAAWRTADQPYYVSDTRAFGDATGWWPRVDPKAGVARLYAWLAETPRRAEPYAQVVS